MTQIETMKIQPLEEWMTEAQKQNEQLMQSTKEDFEMKHNETTKRLEEIGEFEDNT